MPIPALANSDKNRSINTLSNMVSNRYPSSLT
jgi:hypothetical protein